MYYDGKLWIGQSDKSCFLLPKMANRHGLIAGATGTGKTVTLKIMAESFSEMGVPVFLADIKGDLASLATPGSENPKMIERIETIGIDNFTYKSFPVQFWDLFGEGGHRVRTTVSEMGALLLSRILGLNDTQTGVLNIVFRVADENGMMLLDFKDLRAMIQHVGENAKEYTLQYGNISSQSVGAILRSLLALEDQGAEHFFGEPELDFYDMMRVSPEGKGYINILHSVKLFQSPVLYSTFLLWMLSELFETLPETGDLEKPRMVFFFDEAHLVFDDAPKILMDKIEQVVRLIRSKGVGVYFVTQNPMDLPSEVLGQLGNRVQHALRGFTPVDIKKIKAAADTFRQNPELDTVEAITDLKTGEALVSFLDEDGRPGMVERALILPPQSKFGTIEDELRFKIMNESLLKGKYDREIDRESAYELIHEKLIRDEERRKEEEERIAAQKEALAAEKAAAAAKKKTTSRSYQRQTPVEKATNAVMSTIGREVGRTLIRGILGSLKR